MTTMAERLSDLGYSCHQVGKWHCGMASPRVIPSGRGFNSSLGFFNFGEDHYTQIRGEQALSAGFNSTQCFGVDLWQTDRPAFGLNGTYGGYIYTKEAIRVIKHRPADKPIFLFTAFQNIHPPLQVPETYVQMQKPGFRTTVNGMVTFLDESIGNITAIAKSEGIWDQLLVVFSGDNGGYIGNGGDDAPRRGGKFGDFEGGTRVNAFVSGGALPPAVRGTPYDGIVHICDWMATFVHLAGSDNMFDRRAAAANPPVPQPDSLNLWPALSGANITSPRWEVVLSALDNGNTHGFFDWETQYFVAGEAIIQGNFKLILGAVHSGPFGGNSSLPCQNLSPPWNTTHGNPGVPCTCGTVGCLYDVVTDPNETTDISADHPSVVATLQRRMVEVRKGVYNPDRGDLDPLSCDQISTNGGYWGPWLSQ